MLLDVNAVQLQGARQRQEDSYLVRDTSKGLIALVADGLGGHERGDEAGRIGCLAAYQSLEKALSMPGPATGLMVRKAFAAAHKAVQKIPAPHRYSPASTLVGGIFCGTTRRFHCASVGDSLAFLFRDNEVQKLFRPQAVGDTIIYTLGLDLGTPPGASVDVLAPLELQPGDRILLASDGIERRLWEGQLFESLKLGTARQSTERMARLLIGKRAGNQDNATIVVVRIVHT